jgi:hypothetical protein
MPSGAADGTPWADSSALADFLHGAERLASQAGRQGRGERRLDGGLAHGDHVGQPAMP